MKSIRKVALACAAASLLMVSANAGAQGPANQDTFFTFSQPVELPNKTLPAGKYFFQLMDLQGNRHIVKVMSEDKKELHATLMAIPYYSNERPADEPTVRFMETAAGNSVAPGTNAIRLWFYPGNSVGHEFIYPRSQALRLAQRSQEPVLTTKSETEVSESVTEADLTRVDRTGADIATRTAEASPENATASTQPPAATTEPVATPEPAAAPEPAATPQREQIGGLATPPSTPAPAPEPEAAPAPERTDEPARDELPATASMLPLLALIGVGSLVGSRLLRSARR
jgi:hypothetical protein